jgi:hypothetical protein
VWQTLGEVLPFGVKNIKMAAVMRLSYNRTFQFSSSLFKLPSRLASTLVIAEHDNKDVLPLTYNSISAAKQIGGDITVLLAGKDCSKVR